MDIKIQYTIVTIFCIIFGYVFLMIPGLDKFGLLPSYTWILIVLGTIILWFGSMRQIYVEEQKKQANKKINNEKKGRIHF